MEISIFEAHKGKFDIPLEKVSGLENEHELCRAHILRLEGKFSEAVESYLLCLANHEAIFHV